MTVQKQIRPSVLLAYAFLLLAALCLARIGDNGEPFALAFVYAMNAAGLPPIVAVVAYLLPVFLRFSLQNLLLCAAQAIVVTAAFLLQRKYCSPRVQKSNLLPLFALSLSLGGYAAFSPFAAYPFPFDFPFFADALTQKVLCCAAAFLLSAVFATALRALTRKALVCRLRPDEGTFCILFYLAVGVGFCRLFGFNAYTGISFFILLVFAYVTKDPSALVCAFVLSLPSFAVFGLSVERFFFYGIAVTLLSRLNRLYGACALLSLFFLFGFIDGLYAAPTAALVEAILFAVLPVLFFVLLPTPLVRSLENKVVFYREKHLTRVAINRNRAAIGQRLYEISATFREIRSTFVALGETGAQESAKQFIQNAVIDSVCRSCERFAVCKRRNVPSQLSTLIDVGCLKGKSSLIDLPARISESCVRQSDLLYAVNKQIGDYKKYMAEAENAANGRQLLAGQAQGVSEILKNLALEQSEPLKTYTDKERAFAAELARVGVVCNEVLIYGEEDDLTLSLVSYGLSDVKKIAAVATHLFGIPMIISERLPLSQDKYCCILRKKPRYDGAFGVATLRKADETDSGDTHSVVKIDERKFMVALSDGMGSGRYARTISETTLSLLESFYRAKMPSDCVLSTVNKLLTFSREETFACVDIAVIDLDSGRADVVKIGSPSGFILSGNTVKILESSSLPLGILDGIRPDSASYELLENDVLLFLSDGVTGAFPSAADLYDSLRHIPTGNPQQLADGIVQRALQLYGGVAKDDMTAVAVRLFRATA